jgi:hypothetical protein
MHKKNLKENYLKFLNEISVSGTTAEWNGETILSVYTK